jgi:cellulose synthase (UDP-forming)
VAVLDADHVAEPTFLTRTLGYFTDPKVAVVQTPQEFYNVESFEHEPGSGATTAIGLDGDQSQRFHEQALFYRVLQPGKNRWGAAFWCGTGAVVRVAALRDVGLVAPRRMPARTRRSDCAGAPVPCRSCAPRTRCSCRGCG